MSTKERWSTDYTGEAESPFLDEELFAGESEEEWEPRAAALAAESPFQTAFEQDRLRMDPLEREEPESFDEKLFSEEEPFVSQYESEEEENEELDRGVGEYSAAADLGGSEEEFSEAEDAYPEEDEFLYESADSSPAIQAGQEEVTSVPLLKVHHGTGPDLILFWNAMATRPQSVDVIVHLHGYSTCQRDKHIHLSRDTAPRSALVWSDPEGIDPTPGRTRPTLGLLPRGRLFGGKTGRGYNFPALTTETGLRGLVKFGLERLAQRLGVPNLSLGRLILTAHSGGGAPLLKILQHIDPHEIHVFDGLYQSPNALIRWAKKRITQDLNAISAAQPAERYMTEQGGSLRVVYFRSPKARRTETNSLEVLGALKAAIPVGSELRGSYRVERTEVRHCDIPKKYAWRLLADSRAELPELYQPKAPTKREFYTAEEAPFADAELEDRYLDEGRYTESFESQDEEEQADLEPSPEDETSQPLSLKGFPSPIKRTEKLEPIGQPLGGGAARTKPGAAKPASELVRFAQRVLNATQGERLDADGDLGRLTRGALERFRKRYGFGTGSVLDRPTEVALAQRALEELAQQSMFTQLGVLDAKTKQALAAFKAERGLGFDPTLDAATRAALADTLTRRISSSQAVPAPARTGASTSGAPSRAPMSAAKRDKLIAMALTQATTKGTREDREAIAATLKANDTDLATWFRGIVPDATFLGRQIEVSGTGEVPGIHRELLVVLQRAERTLFDKNPGRTAEQLGKDLGLNEIKGLRPPKKASGGKRPSLHCFGLAVDINHDTNPFVGLQKGKPGFEKKFKDNRSPRIIERAMRLLHGEKFEVDKPLKLPPADDAKPELRAGAAWDIHHRASETLAQYLRLADDVNSQRVQTLVAADRSRGHTNTLEWWKRWIATDRSVLKYWDFNHHKNPEQLGYMDLSRDLVVALVGAGLRWGGQFQGAKDMMHFDRAFGVKGAHT